MSTRAYTLPDGTEILLYQHGGIDVKNDRVEWIAIASNPETCARLAELAALASDCKIHEDR